MKNLLAASLLIVSPLTAQAWGGYDYDSGSFIEIEKGNLVRPGREIEYFDYGSGQYRYGTVESMNRYGSTVEVEIYDHQGRGHRTFEMDRPRESLPSLLPELPSLSPYGR